MTAGKLLLGLLFACGQHHCPFVYASLMDNALPVHAAPTPTHASLMGNALPVHASTIGKALPLHASSIGKALPLHESPMGKCPSCACNLIGKALPLQALHLHTNQHGCLS